MDDSFGTILYIIIAGIAFIVSVISKNKKKNARRTTPVNNNTDNPEKERPFISNIERLLNEKLDTQSHYLDRDASEEDYIEEEEPELEKEVVLDFVPPEMLDDKEDTPYSVEYDDTSKIFAKTIEDSEIKGEEEENPLLEEFDLQKAVIYSEIINRKDF